MKFFQYFYEMLAHAKIYESLQELVIPRSGFQSFVDQYVRPFSGCRIVDFGCGPAVILHTLGQETVEYVGVDYNPDYISRAQEQFQKNPQARFICASVDGEFDLEEGRFDIALSVGVLHHLNDAEVGQLLHRAWQALKPGGVLVTVDGSFVRGQNPLAYALLKMDRGRYVRSPEAYEKLLKTYFPRIEAEVTHNRLRIPYTHYLTRCYKE
jgi:2-polyprenyl-3-methyl-5-hydroxy-6-metoxy-1,4-benzoquinol methylase